MQEHKIQKCFAIEDLKQQLNQTPDQLTIIDVRSPEEYAEKHIPGAINIPLNELKNRSKDISNEAIVITACGKGGGRSARGGAALLKQMGFCKANYLCGGTFGWFENT